MQTSDLGSLNKRHDGDKESGKVTSNSDKTEVNSNTVNTENLEKTGKVNTVTTKSIQTRQQTSTSSSSHQQIEPQSGGTSAVSSSGRRGRKYRKYCKVDMKAKLERSRQSARECRARKKLRYQYLEDLVNKRERAVLTLRNELDLYKNWFESVNNGTDPKEALKILEQSKSTDKSAS